MKLIVGLELILLRFSFVLLLFVWRFCLCDNSIIKVCGNWYIYFDIIFVKWFGKESG